MFEIDDVERLIAKQRFSEWEFGDHPLKLCKYTTHPKKFAIVAKKSFANLI